METLYLRQLLVGRDIGRGDPAGTQMQNFVYLVGDRAKGECVVVDPAWSIGDITARAAEDGMKITGALVTHYHPDHVGGSMFGLEVEGLSELMERCPCPVHVHRLEADGVRAVTATSPPTATWLRGAGLDAGVLTSARELVRVDDVRRSIDLDPPALAKLLEENRCPS